MFRPQGLLFISLLTWFILDMQIHFLSLPLVTLYKLAQDALCELNFTL